MRQVELGTTGRMTSGLGYGCSSVLAGMSRRESLRVLEAAFDAGIRHFDVAPLYGYGQAEECVGEFLTRHPGKCTVTTKFGLEPERPNAMKQALRSLARPVLQAFPVVKAKLAHAAAVNVESATARGPLSVEAAKASMESSLRKLRGRIDVYLLHEGELHDLADGAMLRMLEDARRRGDIGTFGVGSDRWKVEQIHAERPEVCPVVQFEWSVLDAPAPRWAAFQIHHRALREKHEQLWRWLQRNDQIAREWSADLGSDLSEREMLATLMLKAAVEHDCDGITLFSTKQSARIAANVRIAEDRELEAPARRFYELVQLKANEVRA